MLTEIKRLHDDNLKNRLNGSTMLPVETSSTGHRQLTGDELKCLRRKERVERHKIVLWKKPLITLYYFLLECVELFHKEKENILKYKKACLSFLVVTVVTILAYMLDGPHQAAIGVFKKEFLQCCYWVGLGILSSVGLGTGLHTFLLYLGPHIAEVTLAAWECGSLDFPEPPYPNKIICPQGESTSSVVNMFTIMSKVRFEAMLWGVGTAIGELPPYFMARAARLSGSEDPDNEDLEELEELISSKRTDIFTRTKKFVPKIVERVGFLGILAFASIPNPIFDLAGITCGHCLVPLWTFFGATLIGKAIIKMHIQQTFVILCFSKAYVDAVLMMLGNIPYIGKYVQLPFKRAVQAQIDKLHQTDAEPLANQSMNILGFIFEKFVILMVLYFVVSIVNSMAQSMAKRIDEAKRSTIFALKTDKGE